MEERQTDSRTEISRMLTEAESASTIEAFLDTLGAAESLHTVFSLSKNDQRALLSALTPTRAASLVEDLPDGHVADLIEDMRVEDAAPIVEEMASDHRVDVLAELDSKDAEAIIAELDEEDASEVRELISYAPDQAGGLMMKEFASYPMAKTVREVVDDLTGDAVDYQLLTVHYVYVVVKEKKLKGVIRLRDLVFADPEKRIGDFATPALTVAPDTQLNELEDFFDKHDIAAVPVVDDRGFLLGIVRRRAVLEALAERAESDNLKAAGIIGGDELRSMPVLVRSRRRLAWLSINIGLNILAASIIAAYGHEWLLRQPGRCREHARVDARSGAAERCHARLAQGSGRWSSQRNCFRHTARLGSMGLERESRSRACGRWSTCRQHGYCGFDWRNRPVVAKEAETRSCSCIRPAAYDSDGHVWFLPPARHRKLSFAVASVGPEGVWQGENLLGRLLQGI